MESPSQIIVEFCLNWKYDKLDSLDFNVCSLDYLIRKIIYVCSDIESAYREIAIASKFKK